MKNNKQSGFTLIELMIVIAILGILAAIAIPAYNDYTIRARISEAIVSVSPFKQAVGLYYYTNSVLPTSRTELGHGNLITLYVDEVTITTSNQISVNINELETGVQAETVDDMFLILTPIVGAGTGAIQFECSVNNAVDGTGDDINLVRYVPPACR